MSRALGALAVVHLAHLAIGCGGGGATGARSSSSPTPASTPRSADAPSAFASLPAPTSRGGGAARPPVRLHTLEDLEALERQQAWSELVEHLEDVAPSERDDRWKALMTHAVVSYLQAERASERRRGELVQKADALERRYPSLVSAPSFVAIRGDIAVAAIDACTSEGSSWERCDSLANGLEGDPKRALLGAQEAARHGHRSLAMKLFRIAGGSDAKAVCSNDQALSVMIEGISRPQGSRYHEDAQALQERCRAIKK